MSAKDISKTLVLKDGVTASLSRIAAGTVRYKKQLKELKDQGMDTWKSIKSGAKSAAITAVTATAAIGAGLIGLGIHASASAETAEKSFGILLNSARDAQTMVSDLRKLSRESPFEFNGLQDSAKMLLGMGYAGQEVMPLMYTLGDAVAATGRGIDELKGIALALGQIKSKGKISAEEMNQLAERGIPAWSLLAKEMGKSTAEVMKLSENGKLFADQALPLIMKGLKDRFGGSMREMSDTFTYTLANIKETAIQMLGGLTKPLFLEIKSDLQSIQQLMESSSGKQWTEELSSGLVKIYQGAKAVGQSIYSISMFITNNWSWIEPAVWGVVGAFAALKTTIAILTVKQLALNLAMTANPIGLIIVGIGALIAVGVALWRNWDVVKVKLAEGWNGMVDSAEWGVNMYIGYSNTILRAYKYMFDSIVWIGKSAWNLLIETTETGVKRMLEPLNMALSAMGQQTVDVSFAGAKFSNAAAPKWDTSYSPIPQLNLQGLKAKVSSGSGVKEDLDQARKEQRDLRKAEAERNRQLENALNANTAALTNNTSATEKNTKARLKDDQSPTDLADSLLGRIERHIWAT
ncbi:MAG TPA: tape measure protein [Brevibacillus sp.]|nr:tape measure protein [Brevibacillus sp.]